MKNVLWFCLGLFLTMGVGGYAILYHTEPGHELRLMMAGSVLTSQHPQYAEYLLEESELNRLKSVLEQLPMEASKQRPIPAAGTALRKSLEVKVDTVDTAGYTAKVMMVSDPTTIRLVATRYADKGQALSELIRESNAVAGINAGGFADEGGTGSGGQMIGIVIGDGKVYTDEDRNRRMLVCGFTTKGEMVTGRYSINELLRMDVLHAVSFGPQLLVDGKNMVTDTVNNAYGWAPRTAIGQKKDGTVIMIITDGRFYHDKRHRGASMKDLTELFEQYDAVQAFALDGGGSTTMIHNGELQLKPATQTAVGMRYLPNAFVVVPHDANEKKDVHFVGNF